MERIVRLIENDPRILMEVVARLEPQNRRRLIVAGGAMEWFGKESAAQEVERADEDKDRMISPKDFDHWFEYALKQRLEDQRRRRESAATLDAVSAGVETPSVGVDARASDPNATPRVSATTVPWSGLLLVALEAALPFVGFGFLDNATMILAGDAIDGTLGFYLNCSTLASAAMGNICSGLVGMQVHGFIDQAIQPLFRHLPVLTEEQMRNRRVFIAGHLGGTVGILIGLLLGMFPLLFLPDDSNEKSDYAMFRRWDVGQSGFIELPELENVLAELGVGASKDTARRVMTTYGEDSRLSYDHFTQLKADLRRGKPIFD